MVDQKKMYLPSLHIWSTKFGVTKNFVKTIDKNGTRFEYLRKIFSELLKIQEKNFRIVDKKIN